jgi:hypothetical protein
MKKDVRSTEPRREYSIPRYRSTTYLDGYYIGNELHDNTSATPYVRKKRLSVEYQLPKYRSVWCLSTITDPKQLSHILAVVGVPGKSKSG